MFRIFYVIVQDLRFVLESSGHYNNEELFYSPFKDAGGGLVDVASGVGVAEVLAAQVRHNWEEPP